MGSLLLSQQGSRRHTAQMATGDAPSQPRVPEDVKGGARAQPRETQNRGLHTVPIELC